MNTVTYAITNERLLRKAFWEEHPYLADQRRRGKPLDLQTCDVRATWGYFIKAAVDDGRVTPELADTSTLKG